jgi:hypothetical protein
MNKEEWGGEERGSGGWTAGLGMQWAGFSGGEGKNKKKLEEIACRRGLGLGIMGGETAALKRHRKIEGNE